MNFLLRLAHLLALGTTVMSAAATLGAGVAGAAPLNIVLLIADDLGYGELTCQGGDIPTPAIDSIADRGVRCTAGYVTASYCSPSRAGLLTGRLQTRFGHEKNPVGATNCAPNVGLPTVQRTLADRLRDEGYATALIGKWHLGGTPPFHPLRRGFDEFYGFLHEGHTYAPRGGDPLVSMFRRRTLPGGGSGRWVSGDGALILSTRMGRDEPPYDADNPILRGSQPVDERRYFTDAITGESIDFIRRHRERPFFLCVAYSAVHSPLQALKSDWDAMPHIEDAQRRIFAGMVHRLDLSVGAILGELEQCKLVGRTLV
ncbi:MAG: sulfatase-like hydrolase/transferase, partial [Planctomycetota bacterium]